MCNVVTIYLVIYIKFVYSAQWHMVDCSAIMWHKYTYTSFPTSVSNIWHMPNLMGIFASKMYSAIA